MQLKELLTKNRSYRRFEQKEAIPLELLKEWISRVRLAGSAANLQPLRFMIVHEKAICAELFSQVRWAAYLKEWSGPVEGERPSAYIVMLAQIPAGPYTNMDAGIALQSILLSAVEDGFGGCAIASFNRDGLQALLQIPESLETLLVIALGKPKEKVVIDDLRNSDVKYWRDKDQVHHVPKLTLAELLLKVFD